MQATFILIFKSICYQIGIYMKYPALVFISILLLLSCHKNNNSTASGNNGKKLKSISSDSAGVYEFAYSGDMITSISGNQAATIQYLKYEDTPCVDISSGDNYRIRYLLNSFKLPTKIIFNDSINGVEVNTEYADFFYHNETNHLDSVIIYDLGNKIIFKATYSGDNISTMEESYVYAAQITVVANYSFTYSNENNVFLKTDSLLYIYSYPGTGMVRQAMVSASFFAETFSASTFNSIHVSGITSDYDFPNNQKSTMTPSVNSNGKIVAETFSDPVFESLAGKKYTYQ
jgi:hypothetical protein